MADSPSDPHRDAPDRYPGIPTWVKTFAVIAVVILLLIVFVLLTGVGGPHGPQRHGASAATAGDLVSRDGLG